MARAADSNRQKPELRSESRLVSTLSSKDHTRSCSTLFGVITYKQLYAFMGNLFIAAQRELN